MFARQQAGQASWHQARLRLSLTLISRAGITTESQVIDVGGGDSTLVDDLLQAGFSRLTVLDISSEALNRAMARLGPLVEKVSWIEADILAAQLPSSHFDLWHDRATFHFLTDPASQHSYLDTLRRALRPQAHVVIATFARDGPDHCSGLPTARYDSETLQGALGPDFTLQEAIPETHTTPAGVEQRFLYGLFRRGGHAHSA